MPPAMHSTPSRVQARTLNRMSRGLVEIRNARERKPGRDQKPLLTSHRTPELWYTGPMQDFRDVDPRELRVPTSRRQGADPGKLARQMSLFGRSAVGMPPPWVYEGTDGVLVLYNGVTRATRIAKLAPGTLIRVEVIGKLPKAYAGDPKIGDLLP